MTLLRRNGSLLNQLPTLFDDFINRDNFNWRISNFSNTNTTIPAVNIKETADSYKVEVAAPGMTKNDFKVALEQQEEAENQKFTRREFSYQAFERSFTLHKEVVDIDKIEAKYEDGVLSLLIPKKEEVKVKAPRLININ